MQQQQHKRRKCRRLKQNKDNEEQGNVQQDDLNLNFVSKSTYDSY